MHGASQIREFEKPVLKFRSRYPRVTVSSRIIYVNRIHSQASYAPTKMRRNGLAVLYALYFQNAGVGNLFQMAIKVRNWAYSIVRSDEGIILTRLGVKK